MRLACAETLKVEPYKCPEPAMRGYRLCRWHTEANRVHAASDKAWKRHVENCASIEDAYSEESFP